MEELTGASQAGGSGSGLVQKTIKQAFAPDLKGKADAAIARFLYAEGVAFNKTLSPYFKDMLLAIGRYGPGLQPPPYKYLGSSLLDAAVEAVRQQLAVGALQYALPDMLLTYLQVLLLNDV